MIKKEKEKRNIEMPQVNVENTIQTIEKRKKAK